MNRSDELDYVYKSIQERVDEKDDFRLKSSYWQIIAFAVFIFAYCYILIVRPPIIQVVLIVAACVISTWMCWRYVRRYNRIEITKKDQIINYLQSIKKALLGNEFVRADAKIVSCILFLNNMVKKYKYMVFTEGIVENLVKIEEILREYVHPVVAEHHQIDPEKLSVISDYLNVASSQIYYNNLKEATKFNNRHFRRYETPVESFVPLSRFQKAVNVVKKYSESSPVARYIITFLIGFIIILALEVGLKGLSLKIIADDILTILLISIGVTYGIEYFRKS